MHSFPSVEENIDRVKSAGCLLCGVIGVQSMQKQVVDSADCSLVECRQANHQHAVGSTGSSLVIRLQPPFVSFDRRAYI